MRNCYIYLVLIVILTGCANHSSSPYNTPSHTSRNQLEAQRLTQRAAGLIYDDPVQAEALLRQALSEDIYHGPAHNNLGVVFLNKHMLYEAANEFEWARKLMPGVPDPRTNLALTLERAGRIDEALATYNTALETYPNHIPTIQALTRLQLHTTNQDERTVGYLSEIALRGETERWRNWAQEQLVLYSE